MNIETVLLIVIVTFACGFVLDRWNARLSRSRRPAGGKIVPCSLKTGANAPERPEAPPWQAHCAQKAWALPELSVLKRGGG